MERIVKRDDWENKPMPRQCAEFLFARQFTEEQYAILIRGHIPEAMEDKWFWYYENGTLYVHRSWTGFCIYVITFDMESGIHKVIVNRDESQYSETSLEHEKVILNNLLKWWTESKYDYYNQWLCETADNLRQQSSCGNSKQETVFEILGIEDKELPVSNLFAYYFDEERNDLCGREFLNLFLDLADVSGILEEDTYVIKREWQMIHEEYKTSIDILVIVGEEKNPKRIICIENKINSEEGENQTERYFKAVEAHFQRCEEKDYLYFTKNNSSVELSSNKFKHIRYRDIREILSRSPFDAMMYAKDFCIYYIDKEEQLFSYIECNDREINSCDEKAFQMLTEYIVWKVNSLRQFENIFCEQKVSAKSAECFYRMYQFEWCFELNVNPDEKRKMNIHLEGYRNGISLHMETMPYEPFAKIKNRYGDVFFDTYVSLRNKLREQMNFEDRDGYECVKIQGNADLSIAKFKVNANTYKEYFDILMKLMDTVGERVSKCIKME